VSADLSPGYPRYPANIQHRQMRSSLPHLDIVSVHVRSPEALTPWSLWPALDLMAAIWAGLRWSASWVQRIRSLTAEHPDDHPDTFHTYDAYA
jgi:hypothetical protein